MSRYSSLRELYITRLREFYRQPARIFWVYGFPTLMAVGLGLAFQNRPPENVRVDLVRNAASPRVERVLTRYLAQPHSSQLPGVTYRIVSEAEAKERVENGDTPLVVTPVAGRYPSDEVHVVYQYDPTRPEATTARLVFDDTLERALGRPDRASASDLKVDKPGSRYIDFLIPGLIGLNTMGGGLWGVGFLLVNFRIAKLLKRFMATPMPRRNFLLAILGARLTFLLPDVGALLLLGVLAFHMPVKGNVFLLILVEVTGALAFAGIGLLVASRARTMETISGLMNLVMLPMWLFCGVFFRSENFPGFLQGFIQALPLTQLVNALRAVILHGADLVAVAPALAILSLWAIGTFWLALRWFRWT